MPARPPVGLFEDRLDGGVSRLASAGQARRCRWGRTAIVHVAMPMTAKH